MALEFWFPSSSASETAVSQFEALIGRKLPHVYLEFMTCFNGGSKPVKENFVVLETGERTMMSDFYSISEGGGGELYDEYVAMKDELPPSCLSVGRDIGGNKLCLVLEGPEQGQVLFYDHERRSFTRKATRADLALCAKSFNQLLGYFE